MPFIYGYIMCTDITEGEIAHSGSHGPCPHSIKICLLKRDNPHIYDYLKSLAGERPSVDRAKPITGNFCKIDIMDILEKEGAMRETDLTEKLVNEIGHGQNNVKFVLKKLAKRGDLICGKDSKDRRYNVYSIAKK
jgi:hypothetical protein